MSRRSARSRAAGTGERGSSRRAAGVRGGEGDVDGDVVPLGRALEQIEVARDERRLGDDAEREPAAAEQDLEDLPGEPELPFGRLVGIGGGADDQRVAAELARDRGCARAPRRRRS